MIEGILFDKDGIIFDSEPYYAIVNIEVCREIGIGLTEETYCDYWVRKGGTLTSYLASLGCEFDIEDLKKKRLRKLEVLLRERVPFMDGIVETLADLQPIYPMALVTSSARDSTDLMLDISGLRNYFAHVITFQDVKKAKPDPECFILASERLGIDRSKLVVIGDAEKDVLAARRAGIKCIAVPNEYTVKNDFSGADRVLQGVSEITPELIGSL